MNTLETIKESILNHRDAAERFPFRHVCLAYLRMHMDNPGLHPDDYLYDGSGYEGWMVILCHKVLTHEFKLPDTFHYPTSFLKLDATLEELEAFHEDHLTDDPNSEDTITHNGMLCNIHSIMDFMIEMKPSELDGVVSMLQELYLFHASENDSCEEEAEKPAGIIKDVADVLNWVQTK